MNKLPRDLWPDATLPILRDPYRYISRRARRLGTDAFRTRLLGRRAVCMTGPEAARLFYEPGAFSRQGAIPERIASVLFGPDGVQRLDGEWHRHRKALFLDLVTGSALDRLEAAAATSWGAAEVRFSGKERIELFWETSRVLTESVCVWAGVPLRPSEVPARAEMLSSLFLEAAAVGPRHRHGKAMRSASQGWARSLIRQARHDRAAGRRDVVSTISGWQDVDGNAISVDAAATELLNVLRPTVAVAVYVTFVVMAMNSYRVDRKRVAVDPDFRRSFVHEVRRLYPFFPMVAAVTAREVELWEQSVPAGTRVLLDLHGTCRDPRAWPEPERFKPERFGSWTDDPWTMVPQGGGDHSITHRCAGEWATIRLMDLFAERLARADYDVLTPEAEPDYSTPPGLPKGGYALVNFRPAAG